MSNEELINNIVWWIPFKKLRNNIRELLYRLLPPPPHNKQNSYRYQSRAVL